MLLSTASHSSSSFDWEEWALFSVSRPCPAFLDLSFPVYSRHPDLHCQNSACVLSKAAGAYHEDRFISQSHSERCPLSGCFYPFKDFSILCGALPKAPPFHGSRSSRETNFSREVTGLWEHEWSRSDRVTNQHPDLPYDPWISGPLRVS